MTNKPFAPQALFPLPLPELEPIVKSWLREVIDEKFHNNIPANSSFERPSNALEAADFLGIALQTLYQNIDSIPHGKKFGKLYFFRSELLTYLEEGKKTAK